MVDSSWNGISPEDGLNNTGNSTRLKVAGAVFGSFVGLAVGLTAPFVISKSILPYMATPGKKVYKALKFLSSYDNNNTKLKNIIQKHQFQCF